MAYITAYNGMYTVDEAAYKQQYMADAGGSPLKGGDFTNLTAFHDAIRSADVIIDEAYWEFGKGLKTYVSVAACNPKPSNPKPSRCPKFSNPNQTLTPAPCQTLNPELYAPPNPKP